MALNNAARGVDYPRPSEYLNQYTIDALRTAFEIFRQHDVLSDLTAHFEQRRQRAVAGDRFASDLHLSVLYWWDEQREMATEHLLAASDARL